MNAPRKGVELAGPEASVIEAAPAAAPVAEAHAILAPLAGLPSTAQGIPAAEAGAMPSMARQDPPPPRALHVFTDERGTQVFIRDAAMDPGTAGALVARIAAELALGGRRLAALTINGQTIFETNTGEE